LVWETSGEVNTERFSIERSINGADYTSIGTVAAVGTGNNRYSFTDYGAAITSCFYRIQVKDLDGQVYYSPVIIIASTSETRIQVFPNPAKSGVVLRTDNSLINTTAKLYDAGGNLLGEFRINAPQQYIDLSRFAKGALQLRLQNGSTFTIIKE
jgi:hypothetical protein